jgi:acetolactate synthase-1/2/3 large subunit
MTSIESKRTGAQILVDQLRIHGVDTAFCVPGESYLAVLNSLHDREEIKLVVTRHEAGACNMAEAYGKLTSRPGICFVTRGPGATHASIGVHTAMQDSTPLILFIGQAKRDSLEKEAFQEIEYRKMFEPMAKWVVQIESAERIPEFIGRAFRIATSGRPGPVVVSLPEDMLEDEAVVADLERYVPAQSWPAPSQLSQLAKMLQQAERPLIIAGGSTWDREATQSVTQFAKRSGLPITSAFRCQDLIDNRDPQYVGHVGLGIDAALAARVRNADLLVVLGDRLSEATSGGYTLIESPVPKQKLIHVHPDPHEIGRVFEPALGIVSDMRNIAHALSGLEIVPRPQWKTWAAGAREEYLQTRQGTHPDSAVDLCAVFKTLREMLPDDAIVTNGAGNYTGWLHRYFDYRTYRTQLAPANGAMGYGVPAAIAAKVVHPERKVVAVSGDGCFMMSAHELATAMMYKLDPIFIVVNNSMFGTIRMHQEMAYPGRVTATALHNPDFVAFAQSFGLHAERVTSTAQFGPALQTAMAAGKAALIELVTDAEIISPKATITGLRQQAAARK